MSFDFYQMYKDDCAKINFKPVSKEVFLKDDSKANESLYFSEAWQAQEEADLSRAMRGML